MTIPSEAPASSILPLPTDVTSTPFFRPNFARVSLEASFRVVPKKAISPSPTTVPFSVLLPWNVTSSSFSLPSRMILTLALSPGWKELTLTLTAEPLFTSVPSMATITSPSFIPALSAELPFATSVIYTPSGEESFNFFNISSTESYFRFLARPSLRSDIAIPRTALFTDPKSIKSSTTFFTIFTGTANEYPEYAPVCETIAVLMPTSSPVLLTRAPPELPGLTAASVCMNDSIWIPPLFLSRGSCAIERPLALTMPAVMVDLS